jgi:hypothetical protein
MTHAPFTSADPRKQIPFRQKFPLQMMRRITLTLLCGLSLLSAGCGNFGYVVREYGKTKPIVHHAPSRTVRVFDQPEKNRMMITETVGDAMRHGFADGSTLGIVNTRVKAEEMRACAQHFLTSHGRKERITTIRELVRVQWEAAYK